MQMSSRKEASVARVDQVGGSRRETVNKDRFSYEGHWFNGAHIRAGAFVLSKAVSLSSNAAKNRFLLWAGVCTPAGPFLLPPFHRTVVAPIHATSHGRSTCTFDHRVQGHRFETRSSSSSERERDFALRFVSKYDHCADMWVILANGLLSVQGG